MIAPLPSMPDPRPLPAADLADVVERVGPDWESLRGASLFITGGSGFIGRWLLESLAAANIRLGLGARAVVLTRAPASFAARAPHLVTRPGIELIPGDVRDFAFPPGHFSHVIHAAAEFARDGGARDERRRFEIIVRGTARAVAFARQAGARRLLFLSSGAVCESPPAGPAMLPENDVADLPLRGPVTPTGYAAGKREAELLLQRMADDAARHGLGIAIARGFAFVGPGLPLDGPFAIGQFLADALAGRCVRMTGDGTTVRSYLYAADLAVWLWRILVRGAPGRPCNVGSSRAVALREVAELVNRVAGGPGVAGGEGSGRAPDRYVPETRRAREELGCAEWTPLELAIAKTLDWHRAKNVDPAAGRHR